MKSLATIRQATQLSKRQFSTLQKIPAILSDIDGVVYRGGHEIGNSKAVVKSLLNDKFRYTNSHSTPFKIAFALLTNGGGIPEQERAEHVNHIIGLEKENYDCQSIRGEDMILCHTPLRDKKYIDEFGDKYVLVSGLGDMIKVAQSYGYKKAIDIEELHGLYPHLHPERRTQLDLQNLNDKKLQMLKRLQKDEEELKRELQFAAIMLWSDAIRLEVNLQIFSDLLISKDGLLGKSVRGPQDPQFVQLFLTNADLVYADKFKLMRHGQGILIHSKPHNMIRK